MSPEQAYQNALILRQAGRVTEAEALLRHVVVARPDYADAWHQLGVVVLSGGRPGEAADFIQRAINLVPGNPHSHSDQGVAFAHLGQSDAAIACYERALQLAPQLPHIHRNLADTLFSAGRTDEAIASYQRALALAPNEAATHNNLGNVFLQQERLEEASVCYERAVQLNPRLLVAQSNLGDMLTKLGRPEAGALCAQRALALDPNFVDGYLNLGVALGFLGRYVEAEASYRQAIARRADFANAHVNLGLLLLLLGRYAEGWQEYEWVWRAPKYDIRDRQSESGRWAGTPIPGRTLLTYADQGVGDTVHFLRYLPLLADRSRATRIIVECQPSLLPLLHGWGGDRFTYIGQDEAAQSRPRHDLHVPLFNVPRLLGLTEPLPMTDQYLHAAEERRTQWRKRLGQDGTVRVGIAWSGNPSQGDNRRRAVPPEQFLPILQVPGITFVSLQITPRAPLPPILAAQGVVDVSDEISDFADTAGLLAELDLVITVDTGTAHVAGAMRRPVWVMLPFMPYWLWGRDHEKTPLYPSPRLFRQPTPGDWAPVIARIAEELRHFNSPGTATG